MRILLACFALGLGFTAHAAQPDARVPPTLAAKIDGIATDALKHAGVPSMSIALVSGGEIVYSIVAIATFVMIVQAWRGMPPEPPLWAVDDPLWALASLLVLARRRRSRPGAAPIG